MYATDPRRVAQIYQDTKERVTSLVTGLDDAALRTAVPACPGWSVRDVVAHLAATADDVGQGRLTGAPTDEETAAQIARFDGQQMSEIVAAWTDAAAHLDHLAESRDFEPPVGDVTSHEHDVRAALGRPGARDSAAVHYSSNRLLINFRPPVPLRVTVDMLNIATGPTTAPKYTCAPHDSKPSVGEPAGAAARSSRRWTGPRTRRGYSITCTCSVRPTSTSTNNLAGATMRRSGSPHRDSVNRAPIPATVDRAAFEAEIDALRAREKRTSGRATRSAAARRAMPMVEVDAGLELTGPDGPVTLLDAFEGRRQPAGLLLHVERRQARARPVRRLHGVTTQVQELGYLHSRDITYAVFCQGPYQESARYRDFMNGMVPWNSEIPLTRRASRRPHRRG